MSTSIRIRETKSGRRYVVRYRTGGRETSPIHGGSFPLLKHARARRDFIRGELAAGRDPRESLRALLSPKPRVRTLAECFDAFSASRIDVSASTTALYRNARDRLGALAGLDPATLTSGQVQEWIAALSEGVQPGAGVAQMGRAPSVRMTEVAGSIPVPGTGPGSRPTAPSENAGLSRGTIDHYLTTLRQVLDFCDLEPNPARSRKIRLPHELVEEVAPPSCAEWQALRAELPRAASLPLRLIECCGLRIGEATALRWGDLDFEAGRMRISKARTKGNTAGQRWLPVPEVLLDELADHLLGRVPLGDLERPVFAVTGAQLRRAMAKACRDAGIAHYHPHELRHLRCSLLLSHGIDAVSLKVWSGHSKASMLTDVYGHVVLDPREDEWRDWWMAVYAQERGERIGVLA